MIFTYSLLQKLNKPGLWFVCSEHPASELKQYIYDFAVESGLPIVVYSGIPKKEIQNSVIDDFMPLYDDGACSFEIETWGNPIHIQSENEMLYLQEEPDNWNEGLDRELTKDMHLIHAFHNLYEHMDFSIFDLPWVRDFNVELHAEIDYHTYKSDEYGDDLDWSKCDYWD